MDFALTPPAWAGQLVDVAGLGAMAVGIAKAFEWVEGALSPAAIKAISNWLKNLPLDSEVGSWSGAFSNLIDQVFGTDPLSIKFIARSCIASVIAVAIIVTIYVRARPIPIGDLADSLLVLGLFSVPNLFVDYVSLLISRSIVHRMADSPTTGYAVWLVVVDGILKVIAATCIIFISSALGNVLWDSSRPWFDALGTLRGFYRGLPFPFTSGGGLQYGIFFYASFFTSIWVWFYVFGGILIKGLARTGRSWQLVVPFLNLDTNPLKSIGRVTGATAVALYVVTAGVSSVAGMARL